MTSFNDIYIIIARKLYVIMKKVNNLFRNSMGVIVNKNNQQDNELSRRIDADLRERALRVSGVVDEDTPDFAEDSEYVKDFKKTGRFGWVWVVLIVLAIISIISIVLI